ncbi:DegV family protein [Peptoniphilus mikwangii]|uniref:DegV family protein n=1 Tax=Peptoniphilus mikwangii TaxID=1354300 RepID=UPI0003F813B0|nr:DegV family protein [Peptoniphilus mikwangii]
MTKIITDSGCDLSSDIIEELGIDILSIIVTNNGTEYRDIVDISSDKMFEMQRAGESFSTSQIPLYDYLVKFEELAKNNQDFIYISLSSGVTGCYNNSLLAIEELGKKYPGVKMKSVDSRCASVGSGLMNYYAALAAKNGASFNQILEIIEYLKAHIKHIFTVFDMEHLYRGGRISRASNCVGKILNIRPLIEVRDGRLEVKELVKGNKKTYKRITEIIEKSTNRNSKNETIFIICGEKLEPAEELEENLAGKIDSNIKMQKVGCTIGAHTGPDIIGAAYLDADLPDELLKYLED